MKISLCHEFIILISYYDNPIVKALFDRAKKEL